MLAVVKPRNTWYKIGLVKKQVSTIGKRNILVVNHILFVLSQSLCLATQQTIVILLEFVYYHVVPILGIGSHVGIKQQEIRCPRQACAFMF